jgi:hypothetical protein
MIELDVLQLEVIHLCCELEISSAKISQRYLLTNLHCTLSFLQKLIQSKNSVYCGKFIVVQLSEYTKLIIALNT